MNDVELEILETIAAQSGFISYKVLNKKDGSLLTAKVTAEEFPPLHKIAYLKNEIEITQSLNHTGIPRPIEFTRFNNRPAVLFQYDEGRPFSKAATEKLSIDVFLSVALHLSEIIKNIHVQDITHKNISCNSVFFDATALNVTLTEFGFASRLRAENQQLENFGFFNTSLEYYSPEQTGRMNRSIDYRTDFYSLGVVFYELLTGINPFRTDDRLKIIYNHIARIPDSPSAVDPAIPKAISAIILKLLSKNAEDRYQSALGLQLDLARCKSEWDAGNTISTFLPGLNDFSGKFQVSQKLFGREKDIEMLLHSFESVAAGNREVIFITGYSGIGKSALINEIQKPIASRQGLFLSGKFEELQRNIPYSAFIQAFKKLIDEILSAPADVLASWKSILTGALRTNASVVINVIPELELIIGKQPLADALSPAESQNRFNQSFRNFMLAFITDKRPLVLSLDDLQWADGASISLIQNLAKTDDAQYLMLIGAYRHNEVDPLHPLALAMEQLRKEGTHFRELFLEPLDSQAVNQLVEELIGTANQKTKELAAILLRISQGNPFFINQFLQSLYKHDKITFNYQSAQWEFDPGEIQAVDIPEEALDITINNMQSLPAEAQQVLKLASGIGSRFDTVTLSAITGKKTPELIAVIWDIIQAGIIQPLDSNYQLIFQLRNDQFELPVAHFKFVHDKMQQAAYSLMNDDEKSSLHYRIAKALLARITGDEVGERVFDIVTQLNSGRPMLQSPAEKAEAVTLNMLAAKKARESIAYESALQYLEAAIKLFDEQAWITGYTQTFNTYLSAGECASLCDRQQEAARYFKYAHENAQTNYDRARVYYTESVLFNLKGKLPETFTAAQKALELLNVHFPSDVNKWTLAIAFIKIRWLLLHRNIEQLKALPLCSDATVQLANKILAELKPYAYNKSNDTLGLLILKSLELNLKYGLSDAFIDGFAGYGVILAVGLSNFRKGWDFTEVAFELAKKLNSALFFARASYSYGGMTINFVQPARNGLVHLENAYKLGVECGDYTNAAYATMNLVISMYYNSFAIDELLEKSRQYLSFTKRIRYDDMIMFQTVLQRHLFKLSDTPPENWPSELQEPEAEFYARLKSLTFKLCLIYYQTLEMSRLYMEEQYAEAAAMLKEAETNIFAIQGTLLLGEFYLFKALILSAVLQKGSPASEKLCRKGMLECRTKLMKWSKTAPDNFRHRLFIVEGELARQDGDTAQAITHFINAARDAASQKFLHMVALTHELSGKLFLEKGMKEVAAPYLQYAFAAFKSWGAHGKANQLKEKYLHEGGESVTEVMPAALYGRLEEKPFDNLSERLDLNSVMQAALAISGEIVLDKLLVSLIKIVMQNAGAETGYLIVERQGRWLIEAEGEAGEDTIQLHKGICVMESAVLPKSVIQYVIRTGETLVLFDVNADSRFAFDPAVIARKSVSVLCLPVINKGITTGILYLENNLSKGVFTNERVALLKFLSGQIAVSLENASLYDNLEQRVRERTQEVVAQKEVIEQEKKKSDDLLLNILPAETADELKRKGFSKPRRFELVTVMFTDFVNFTGRSELVNPSELVDEINGYYSAFDNIIAKHGLEKIKTIGDSYMCAGGLPVENASNPYDTINAAIEIQQYVQQLGKERKQAGQAWFDCRIGVHSGPVVAGIVGIRKFAYDIWGDTVNIASRMEASGEPGKVNISGATYELVKDRFNCEPRGKIEAKNKGYIDMYFVLGKNLN
ncbi:MAG: AAA family ATPase [Chitinophagales bacterium]|nr:AAA family ATPase [Chitinophagales bacterium]